MFRPRPGAPLVLALSLLACGGASDAVVPGAVGDPIVSLRIQGVPASMGVGDTAMLSAQFLRRSGTVGDTNLAVVWQQSSALSGTLSATGAMAVLRAQAAGVDTIRVAAGSFSSVAPIEIAAPRASAVRISERVLLMAPGASAPLTVRLLDTRGNPVTGRPILWASLDGAVAQVDTSGTVRALATGTARVMAVVDGHVDTAAVLVRGAAGTPGALVLSDSLLRPGTVLTMTGAEIGASTVVAISGASAGGVAGAGTIAVTPPLSLWQPCRATGTALAVTIQGTVARAVTLSAAPAALRTIHLEPGAMARVGDAVAAGCPVGLDAGGTYLVMPYRWDTRGQYVGTPAYVPSADSLQLTLAVTPMGVTPSALRSPVPAAPARLVSQGAIPPDVVRRSSDLKPLFGRLVPTGIRPTVAPVASCRAVPALGDSVPVYTRRSAKGGITSFDQNAPVEYWRVAAVSAKLLVLYDSSTVRRADSSGVMAARQLRQFTAAYDSTVAPVLDGLYTTPLPDLDHNGGRIVVYLTSASEYPADAFAMATSHFRVPCDETTGTMALGQWTPGEAILKSNDQWFKPPYPSNPDNVPSPDVQTMAHEAGHVYQISRSPASRFVGSWADEGWAETVSLLWQLRQVPNALEANLSTVSRPLIEGYPAVATCFRVDRRLLPTLPTMSGGYLTSYQMACGLVGHILQRRHAMGGTLQDAVAAWTAVGGEHLTYAAMYNAVLGTARTDSDIWAETLMGWYADDLPGMPSELQNTTWNSRAVWTAWFGGGLGGTTKPYPLPEISFGTTGGTMTFGWGSPDVRHVEATLSGAALVTLAGAGGGGLSAGTRTDLAILRVR